MGIITEGHDAYIRKARRTPELSYPSGVTMSQRQKTPTGLMDERHVAFERANLTSRTQTAEANDEVLTANPEGANLPNFYRITQKNI